MDYEATLDRAYEELPERSASQKRLQIPDPAVQEDGAFTRLTNLKAIADALSREAEHVHRFVQREFGTNGSFDDDRSRYNGSFDEGDFEAALDHYAEEYVVCSECGLPDTKLTTEDRTQMLRCEACGAFRPVEKRAGSSSKSSSTTATLEEGETYQVKITGMGRKGDGVAEKGKYRIFVPGTSEGDELQVYIDNISGTLAFARPVQ
ncbi:translation initiation factor IF-2 subunit beta [Halorientalis salina]|uniref:translation initiation factor IF-2 subunit beta n=1 Tax=Halorientalis salina TaxID=2932266 RepID=UPI0010AB6395|nr:translation initiation factor IF-2 subunit beta [Halorientalis salina]